MSSKSPDEAHIDDIISVLTNQAKDGNSSAIAKIVYSIEIKNGDYYQFDDFERLVKILRTAN